MSEEHKTIVNIKIRGSRLTKEILMILKLGFFFALFLVLLAAAQVKFCKVATPQKPWDECLIRKTN